MSTIQFKSSIAFDVLCFIEKCSLNDTRWMNGKQIAEIENINSKLPSNFEKDCIGMSNICYIISAFCDNDFEKISLNDLIHIFECPGKIRTVVKNKIANDFTSAYIYPILDCLNEGFSEQYIRQLSALKSIGFEAIYNERIMPMVQEEICKKTQEIKKSDCKGLFNNIAVLKNSPPIKQSDIYVSFFSAPTAFTLYGSSFLTCFCPAGTVDFFAVAAHELMHGFASNELTDLYRKYTQSNKKLSACHKALIEKYQSGDEEEFVMAAEYYLCWLSGDYSKEQLMGKAENRYGGNCPISVSVFELLLQEKEIPTDYNQWLIRQFKNGSVAKQINLRQINQNPAASRR